MSSKLIIYIKKPIRFLLFKHLKRLFHFQQSFLSFPVLISFLPAWRWKAYHMQQKYPPLEKPEW